MAHDQRVLHNHLETMGNVTVARLRDCHRLQSERRQRGRGGVWRGAANTVGWPRTGRARGAAARPWTTLPPRRQKASSHRCCRRRWPCDRKAGGASTVWQPPLLHCRCAPMACGKHSSYDDEAADTPPCPPHGIPTTSSLAQRGSGRKHDACKACAHAPVEPSGADPRRVDEVLGAIGCRLEQASTDAQAVPA